MSEKKLEEEFMMNIREEYESIRKQRVDILEELKKYEENDIIKRYQELQKKIAEVDSKLPRLYREAKLEEYASCHHVLVCSRVVHDTDEGRTYKLFGCVKCGLDGYVMESDSYWLTDDKRIMYDYLRSSCVYGMPEGLKTGITCDLDLACSIYSKIKEAHPNIPDEVAVTYFESALYNIRNIEVSEERKASRAKRLSLYPSFKRWNVRDVCVR